MSDKPDPNGIAWLIYDYGQTMHRLGRAAPSDRDYWNLERRLCQRRIDEWLTRHGYDDLNLQPSHERLAPGPYPPLPNDPLLTEDIGWPPVIDWGAIRRKFRKKERA